MKTKTQLFIELWVESRTRFTNQLETLSEQDLPKKLSDAPNSLGFLMQHICEVELLFAKNVFGDSSVKIIAKTLIAKQDTGEWTDLEALKNINLQAFESLKAILEKQNDADWETTVTTKEFGTKTKAEAFARVLSQTAYHAGQMALITKYGK